MPADDLRLLKQYMHIYHDEDDSLISKLWAASVAQLEENGIEVIADDRAWLAAAGLTLQWYDCTPLHPGIRELLNGLKLKKPAF